MAGAGAQSYNSAGAGAGDEKPEFAQHYGKPLSKMLSSGQIPDGAVKCPTGPSNARPGRQIPAYMEVMLSQMPWGCPGGLIAVGFDSYITLQIFYQCP